MPPHKHSEASLGPPRTVASWVFASMVLHPPALAIAVMILVPATYRGPPMTALPLHRMLPLTSKEGMLTPRRNVAELGASPSSTVPASSERLRFCPTAALIREHVRLASSTETVAPNSGCLLANVATRLGIESIVTTWLAAFDKASPNPYTKSMLGIGLATLIRLCLFATTAAKFAMASSNALPEISISEEEILPSGASVMFVSTSMPPCP